MNTNDIKFLRIEIGPDQLTIKEPYLKEVLKYMDQNRFEFEYIEAKIIIATKKIGEDGMKDIISMIKDQRDTCVQSAISKSYL